MKWKIVILSAVALLVLVAAIWLFGLPEHPTQIVSKTYNFSAYFPDTPVVETSVSDEGTPSSTWTVKHDHGTWVEYFQVSATCYKEVLDPAKEFDGADADPVLVLNGVKVLRSEHISAHDLETSREFPAYSRLSQDTGTGNIMSHVVIIDGRCMIDAGARMDKNEGPASLFMSSVKILK